MRRLIFLIALLVAAPLEGKASDYAISPDSKANAPTFPTDSEDALREAYRQYRNAKRSGTLVLREDERPILPNCQDCNPISSLALAVNAALEKLPEAQGDRELQDRIEIVDRLSSTVLAPESSNGCDHPTKHGLMFFHDIADSELELLYASDIDISKVESLKYQDSRIQTNFFRAKSSGQDVILRLDKFPDGRAEVRLYKMHRYANLPDLSGESVKIAPRKENEGQQIASSVQTTTKTEQGSLFEGPSIEWRKNGLPRRVKFVGLKHEDQEGLVRWNTNAEVSTSGLRANVAFQNQAGRDVAVLTSSGSDSVELQIPLRMRFYNGLFTTDGNVRINSDRVSTELALPSGSQRQNQSVGATIAKTGEKDIYYSWLPQKNSRVTVRYRAAPAPTVGGDLVESFSRTVLVEYEREL